LKYNLLYLGLAALAVWYFFFRRRAAQAAPPSPPPQTVTWTEGGLIGEAQSIIERLRQTIGFDEHFDSFGEEALDRRRRRRRKRRVVVVPESLPALPAVSVQPSSPVEPAGPSRVQGLVEALNAPNFSPEELARQLAMMDAAVGFDWYDGGPIRSLRRRVGTRVAVADNGGLIRGVRRRVSGKVVAPDGGCSCGGH